MSDAPPFLVFATPADFNDLVELERSCFEPERRSKPRALRHALRSSAQRVMVLRTAHGDIAGALIALLYPKTLRIYSVAVKPEYRGKGWGERLVAWAESFARETGRTRVSLEAGIADPRLVQWYARQGYKVTRNLPNYYATDCHAVRMEKTLPG